MRRFEANYLFPWRRKSLCRAVLLGRKRREYPCLPISRQVICLSTGCVAVMVMVMSGAVGAQAPTGAGSSSTGPAAEVQRSYAGVKGNILKAAEKMPAEAYGYKPTADIRTFARIVNHVTEAQARSCGAINGAGAADAVKAPEETADKAAIVAGLQASFAACDRAFSAATDANLAETFSAFGSKRSRVGLLWGTVAHDQEQYATLALYLRLKGIMPPSSEK